MGLRNSAFGAGRVTRKVDLIQVFTSAKDIARDVTVLRVSVDLTSQRGQLPSHASFASISSMMKNASSDTEIAASVERG